MQTRWHMREPAGFEASVLQYLDPAAKPALAHAVDWHVYQQIHEWDAKHHAGARMLHRLTNAHFVRTSHSRMSLGPAIDIFRPEHARVLRMLRAVYA